MAKQEVRKYLSILFLQGLRDILKSDSSIEVVNVQVCRVKEPDYNKAGSFRIYLIDKTDEL
ncbi:MAG: hypothetical protein GYB35_09895 [Algicola sp.]|nr:hypothetical protein [Algicola sp.]